MTVKKPPEKASIKESSRIRRPSKAPEQRPADNSHAFSEMLAALPDAEVTPAAQFDGRALSEQIMEQLQKYNLASSCQLRIEVHNGVVVVAGEVPSAYEMQLIAHLCRQIPGVEKFVDGMVIRKTNQGKSRPNPRIRPVRRRVEWNLPFRAWHAVAAVGVIALLWLGWSIVGGKSDDGRFAVYRLRGELQLDGEPAFGAAIILHPEDASVSVRPKASVKADGKFDLTTYQPGDGAPAGRYVATVEWRRPLPGSGGEDAPRANVIPAVYSNPKTTPIRVTVAERDNQFPPITFKN